MDKEENEKSGQKKNNKGKNKSKKNLDEKRDQDNMKNPQIGILNSDKKSADGTALNTNTIRIGACIKPDAANGDYAIKSNAPLVSTEEESNLNKKTNKSREEILAEREAKKLAKQALKKKAKEDNTHKKLDVSMGKQNEPMKNQLTNKNTMQNPKEISQSNQINSMRESEVKSDNEQLKENKGSAVPIANDKDKNEGKSKAQLRAERRAKQELERARKLEKAKEVKQEKVSSIVEVSRQEKIIKESKTSVLVQDKIHKVKLFSHLYRDLLDCIKMEINDDIHPSILELGTQYRSKVILGANARCLALLNAFKAVVCDYKTPPKQEFSRGLEAEISKSMTFLNRCRPVAVSMSNAVKHLRFQINQMEGSEDEMKRQINDWIETYIKEQIEKAAEAISLFALQKITDGDVILTYSCSSLIQRTLIKAQEKKIKFRVIVVDGRPLLEGKEMLRRLVKAGINCTYVFFNGLSFIMPEVTKILLGAHALLANGYVMSRIGSSQIALLAKTYNVPVLVCCETHKFSEKVQTDSFVHNELDDPDMLVSNKGFCYKESSKWKTMQYLTPLNLMYDVTPPDLVSAVVTEIAVLPCTSVPVILRVKPSDLTC